MLTVLCRYLQISSKSNADMHINSAVASLAPCNIDTPLVNRTMIWSVNASFSLIDKLFAAIVYFPYFSEHLMVCLNCIGYTEIVESSR